LVIQHLRPQNLFSWKIVVLPRKELMEGTIHDRKENAIRLRRTLPECPVGGDTGVTGLRELETPGSSKIRKTCSPSYQIYPLRPHRRPECREWSRFGRAAWGQDSLLCSI
jgi:hypothetical protein